MEWLTNMLNTTQEYLQNNWVPLSIGAGAGITVSYLTSKVVGYFRKSEEIEDLQDKVSRLEHDLYAAKQNHRRDMRIAHAGLDLLIPVRQEMNAAINQDLQYKREDHEKYMDDMDDLSEELREKLYAKYPGKKFANALGDPNSPIHSEISHGIGMMRRLNPRADLYQQSTLVNKVEKACDEFESVVIAAGDYVSLQDNSAYVPHEQETPEGTAQTSGGSNENTVIPGDQTQ